MKHLEVVAAILEYDGKILCMERGQGKFEYVSFKYEIPGGKIEPGEEDLYMTVHHDYPDFSISLHAFRCRLDKPDFIRKEHVDAKWMAPADLPTLDWAPADVPIMQKLAGK